jgi:hypothetical protein
MVGARSSLIAGERYIVFAPCNLLPLKTETAYKMTKDAALPPAVKALKNPETSHPFCRADLC